MSESPDSDNETHDQAYHAPSDTVAVHGDEQSSLPAPVAEFEAVESSAASVPVEGSESAQPDELRGEGSAAAPESDVEQDPAASEPEASAEPAKTGSRPATNGAATRASAEPQAEPASGVDPATIQKNWYILKVQSNREDSIRDALQRRVAMSGLDPYFGDIIVPTEMVSEFKAGKKRVVKRKLYPGYLVVHMEINDDTWFLVRETPGIGDFTGTIGKPTPMLPHEVQRILIKQEEKTDEAPKLKINVNKGDRVKINEGTFENFEGEVDVIDEANGRVTVMINIFGRSTPVELEYWQIEGI